jgi:hypothetical protein
MGKAKEGAAMDGSAFAKMPQDCGAAMADVFNEERKSKEKHMTFGEALAQCRKGARIARAGWNGKDQFVYYQEGSTVPVGNIRNASLAAWAREQDLPEVELWGHFDFKPTNNKIQCGWLASQSDMQADDWEIVSPGEAYGECIEADLTLPIDNIGGLHFTEQKVHAVFEKQDDGWWQSSGALFISARNSRDDNSRDALIAYLKSSAFIRALRDQLPDEAVIKRALASDIEVSLPAINQGSRRYNGACCWYWLADRDRNNARNFCVVDADGDLGSIRAGAVGGVAPAFRVRPLAGA